MHIHQLFSYSFPEVFARFQKPPTSVYCSGDFPSGPRLGVIGTRKPSSYGLQALHFFLSALPQSVVIVSGGAYGIDIEAHKYALSSGNPTIAVLASGFHHFYPRIHTSIFQNISQKGGCLLSLYSPEIEVQPYRFLERNALLAAFCDVLLVIEAGEKSGTRITASYAAEFGIPVFCVPGSIFESSSVGTHQLISEGASPLWTIEPLYQALKIEYQSSHESSPDISPLLRLLQSGPKTLRELQSKIHSPTLLQELTELEILGNISLGNDFRYYICKSTSLGKK